VAGEVSPMSMFTVSSPLLPDLQWKRTDRGGDCQEFSEWRRRARRASFLSSLSRLSCR